MSEQLIETWRAILKGHEKSWVVFKRGTCVVLEDPGADPASEAMTLMKKWGQVRAGSPAGDFAVVHLDDKRGWVVTSHIDNILTYVGKEEIVAPTTDLQIGLLGRAKRNQDAQELEILHVEEVERGGNLP